MIITSTDIFFDGMAVTGAYLFLTSYGEWLSRGFREKHGRLAGYAARTALVFAPTVILGVFSWKLAAAGLAMWTIMHLAFKLFGPREFKPTIPTEVYAEALATGLTGEAFAQDLIARCEARGIKLGSTPKS